MGRLSAIRPALGSISSRLHRAPDIADPKKAAEANRMSAKARGYDSKWAKASKGFLAQHPVCEYGALNGRVEPATLTDHLYPQREHPGVFWERKWWVASCAACHSGFKQSLEAQGKPALDALARRLGRDVLPG